MIGELSARQIVALSQQGLSAAEISEVLKTDEASVRLVLNRNEVGVPEDRDIDDAQLKTLRKNAYDLALGAEDDNTRARMTMFLIERDRPVKKKEDLGGARGNITLINQAILQSNAKVNELLSECSVTDSKTMK